MLSGRGIDPRVSAYFSTAPRFSEGEQKVVVFLNGDRFGLIDARFDPQGQLCFTPQLLEALGLRLPSRASSGEACRDFLEEYPQTEMVLRPHREEVFLVVPTQALREPEFNTGVFSQGGAAGLFNYEVQGLHSQSRYGNSRFFSANTEAGFNLGDWIVRSRQLHFSADGERRTESLYTYAQRDFLPFQKTFQVGQIQSAGPVFGGVPLSGVQLTPDGIQGRQADNGVRVEGVAPEQSRIEVRQAGALIYTTIVPEGPFSLGGLPLLNGSSDLEVSVVGEGGIVRRRFVVPAASFQGMASSQPGYYLALGKLRTGLDGEGDPPLVATGSGSWALGRQVATRAGFLGSNHYRSVGWGLDTHWLPGVAAGVQGRYAYDDRRARSGAQNSLSLSSSLGGGLTLGASATVNTQGYRDIYEANREGVEDFLGSRFKHQYTTSLGWLDPALGGFNIGYTRSALFDGQTSAYLHGSWNKSFRYASVSLNLDSSVGPSSGRQISDSGLNVRLGGSIPLGGDRSVNASASRRGDRLGMGAEYSERLDDQASYKVGVEHDFTDRAQAARGSLSLMPRYTQVGLGINQGAAGTGYSGQLKGGIALHEGGLTFSPHVIDETFGVATVGELPGVKISTPQGPVWTDFKGQAVIPGLQAYSNSFLELQTRSLPRHVDIRNGTRVLEVGRGSFSKVDFEVLSVRRVLVRMLDAQGRPLPQGAAVFTPDRTFVTTVVSDGMVFLSDVEAGRVFTVSLPDLTSCELSLELPEKNTHDTLYETATAVCRAG